MNPTDEEVTHALHLIENQQQMPEYRDSYGYPRPAQNLALMACGFRVAATLGILALALIGLCRLLAPLVTK